VEGRTLAAGDEATSLVPMWEIPVRHGAGAVSVPLPELAPYVLVNDKAVGRLNDGRPPIRSPWPNDING